MIRSNRSAPTWSCPELLFAGSRISWKDSAVILVAVVVSFLLQGRDVPVPLIPGDAVVRTSPLLPLLVAVPLVAVTANPMVVLEASVNGLRLIVSRALWAAALSLTAVVLSAMAAAGGDPGGIAAGTAGLNAGCFMGLGLLCAVALGADLAWVAPCLLALVTFYFGKTFDDQVRTWAWLLHDPPGVRSRCLSGGLVLAGLVLYALLDSGGIMHRKLKS